MTHPSTKPDTSDRTMSVAFYLVFGIVVVGSGIFYRTPLTHALYSLESTVDHLGILGPAFLVAVTAVWAILCLPGPVVFGFVGTIYSSHPHNALLVVLASDAIAQAVGFLVARHLWRERATKWLSKKPWFLWLEEQAELRGAYGVLVIRMMPFFPNSLANYAFGLSALRFGPYLLASVLGSIPNLGLYIYGTAGAIHLIRSGLGEDKLYLAGIVIASMLIALVILQGFLRRHGKLAEWLPDSGATED